MKWLEPCESRGSRTVLGAPGGEIPPGDSTQADLQRHHQEGPHLGVKQTKSGAKRTLPLDGLLSGVKQTYRRHDRGVRF